MVLDNKHPQFSKLVQVFLAVYKSGGYQYQFQILFSLLANNLDVDPNASITIGATIVLLS